MQTRIALTVAVMMAAVLGHVRAGRGCAAQRPIPALTCAAMRLPSEQPHGP